MTCQEFMDAARVNPSTLTRAERAVATREMHRHNRDCGSCRAWLKMRSSIWEASVSAETLHKVRLAAMREMDEDMADPEYVSAPQPIKLNSTVHPEAVPRLSRQCQAILDRLKEGPASNDELCRMARKYTSRLSDLRKSGYVIEAYDLNHATGICWYRLKGE